jgi:hypothetical protein
MPLGWWRMVFLKNCSLLLSQIPFYLGSYQVSLFNLWYFPSRKAKMHRLHQVREQLDVQVSPEISLIDSFTIHILKSNLLVQF